MQMELLETGKEQLQTFLKIASKLNEQFIFHIIDETAIEMKTMDPAHVAMTHLVMSGNDEGHHGDDGVNSTSKIDQFDQFRVIYNESTKKETISKPFQVDTRDVIRILNHMKKNNVLVVTLEFDSDTEQSLLGLSFLIKDRETGIAEKEIRLPVFDVDMNIQKINLGYHGSTCAEITMDTGVFVETINELKEYEIDNLTIKLEPDTSLSPVQYNLVFVNQDTKNERKKIEITKKKDRDFVLVVDQKKEPTAITGLFAINYLSNLVPTNPIYKTIQLVMEETKPITIRYNNDEAHSNLYAILAPKASNT